MLDMDSAFGLIHERQEWQDIWDEHFRKPSSRFRKFALDLHTSDIAYAFNSSHQWLRIFRVLVSSKDNNRYLPPGYHLSGIGYLPTARNEKKYLLAPKDPNIACLGDARRNSWTLPITPVQHPLTTDFTSFRPGPFDGYVMHSRCWDIIELQLGPAAASRLDLIASSLVGMWQDIVSGKSEGNTGLEGVDPYPWYYDFDNDLARPEPLYINQVDELLYDCRRLLKTRFSRTTKNLLTFKYNLPQEIQYLITGYLRLFDIYNMLTAFDETFPVSFWEKRVPLDLLFEFKKIFSENGHNTLLWAYVATEIYRRCLLSPCTGMLNRRRILDKITPLKKRVLEAMEDEERQLPN
ncbi:hypothetical protein FQN54_002059 [Arachnomyces sp. PD_36]|nr:hypothetical protein FQN54_002059 [Arachnomyces sp. PD_36]